MQVKMDMNAYHRSIEKARKSKMNEKKFTQEEIIALKQQVHQNLGITHRPITRDVIQLTNPSSGLLLAKIQEAEREGHIVEVLYQVVYGEYHKTQHCYTLIVKEKLI